MKELLEVGEGAWREIEAADVLEDGRCNITGAGSATAVGHVAQASFRQQTGDRYFLFSLDATPERHDVAVGIATRPESRTGYFRNGPTVVGFANGNPFPKFEAQIKALGDLIGVELMAEHYPYTKPFPSGITMPGAPDPSEIPDEGMGI